MTHDTNFVSPGTPKPKGSDPDLSVVKVSEVDPRMRPTIIVICGLPRTGKDTFANAMIEYANSEERDTRLKVQNLSSVDTIKGFLDNAEDDMLLGENSPVMFDASGEATDAYRSCISDIKAALDKHFNYTLRYAERIAATLSTRDVFFFHVRETENLRKLQFISNANFLSVHTVRADRPDTPLATSDRDGLDAYGGFAFDYPIRSRIEDMKAHAELVYNHVARICDGTDRPSNLIKRTRVSKPKTTDDPKSEATAE